MKQFGLSLLGKHERVIFIHSQAALLRRICAECTQQEPFGSSFERHLRGVVFPPYVVVLCFSNLCQSWMRIGYDWDVPRLGYNRGRHRVNIIWETSWHVLYTLWLATLWNFQGREHCVIPWVVASTSMVASLSVSGVTIGLTLSSVCTVRLNSAIYTV